MTWLRSGHGPEPGPELDKTKPLIYYVTLGKEKVFSKFSRNLHYSLDISRVLFHTI